VDPAWVMAQIMAESFFYEFAVSWAFAVGVCQFVGPTARSHGMLCAGDRPAHASPPYRLPELACELTRYTEAREAWKEARRAAVAASGGDTEAFLREAVGALLEGRELPGAQSYLTASRRVEDLDARVKESREKFRSYLEANFEGRDIFRPRDLGFLVGFDERVTYSKPVRNMVLMLATNLKARNGNILAATAGYNAGLGSTADQDRIYEPYGRIPSYAETVTYTSRIVVNHHEIVSRM